MKKKLGIIIFAVALFGATSASAASEIKPNGPNCYWVGSVWVCDQ
ncbi:hypothetical protein [Cytobacillus sp.]|nr:hypothetical protein [Cytobacillus sp.]